MAVTCTTKIRTGAPAGSTATITNLNFGSAEGGDISVTSNPITAGDNSFELWTFLAFTGVGNQVDNLQVWKSAGAYVSGENILSNADDGAYQGLETYAQATPSASTIAVVTIPTTDPGTANLGVSGALASALITDGDSDYWVLQLTTTAGISAGDVNTKTFTIQWDEQ